MRQHCRSQGVYNNHIVIHTPRVRLYFLYISAGKSVENYCPYRNDIIITSHFPRSGFIIIIFNIISVIRSREHGQNNKKT